jgi:membrane-associated phospholipid phosphatase
MGNGMSEAAVLRLLDRGVWIVVATVAGVVLAAPLVSNFTIAWATFAPPAAICLALAAGAWLYRNLRPDPKLASGLECTAQLIAFAAVGAPLSYLAAAAGAAVPLQDHVFDAIDRAMRFDWMALLGWMNNSPAAFGALRLVYGSLLPQMALAVLCLAFTGRLTWLRVYTLAFLIATLVTIALSAVLPAEGVWLHYKLTEADARTVPVVSTVWPVFTGLRDGSVRALVALGAEGVITFPSLHAALAVIMIAALWPIRALRWIVLILNATMLIATPIDGAHYLVDVVAGIAIAALSLVAAGATVRRAERGHAPTAAAASQIPRLAARD